MKLGGIVFDFDGTLTCPGAIDFAAIRREIACPEETSIIYWIEEILTGADQQRALELLLDSEEAAARRSVPREGAEAFIQSLRNCGLPLGILTRNTHRSLEVAFGCFTTITADWFNPVLSRDDPFPRKPEPQALVHIASTWGIDPQSLLFVGDYRDDVETALRAGALSCWLTPPEGGPLPSREPHFTCRDYSELADAVRGCLGLNAG
jgi:HAD superfamily hydrolase (TIGR01509 family)